MTFETDSKTAIDPYQNTPRVEKDSEGVWHIRGYTEAKELLKEDLLQDGFNAEDVFRSGMDPVLYQHGKPHREQRAAIAKYFSPTTVSQKHMPMMEKAADDVLAELIKNKRMDLKTLSRNMAAIVTSAVIGLTPNAGMVRRVDAMLHSPIELPKNPFSRLYMMLFGNLRRISFFVFDVRPAIAERKRNPQDDVISYMLSKDKDQIAILAECIVYGAAGMATTQEFICAVLMHALEKPHIHAALTSDDISARYEALHEVLRLEPVIGKIKRKVIEPVSVNSNGETHHIPTDAKIEFHVYDVNADAQSVEAEPERLHPHRDLEKGTYRSLIGFGSGPHRCAGEHLAIAETDVFIRKLLALKGLRIEKQPDIIYNKTVEGYEINDLIIAVD
ncbi:MAG: cytochrome P450 [Anaerolineales bacterium]|nr:cytochrome P450 [Anaerolineales bacterium]